jgi:hypothetical protein
VRSLHVIAMLLCSLSIAARIVAAAFTAQVAAFYDDAAAATRPDGGETSALLDILETRVKPAERIFSTTIAVSRIIESSVLLFVASGFLLFFPATIIMFCRVEQKMENLIQELWLRTDVGNAFLPFEFSPRAADGSEIQMELPIADTRQYMQELKSSASAQRWRFSFCLGFVIIALVALTSNALFVAIAYVGTARDPSCGRCDPSCQSVQYIMLTWYVFTPELFPLITSLSSTLPLVFALWMMTTPEDRELLLHPSRFLTQKISLNPVETSRQASLYSHRIRMGIDLVSN